MLLTSSSIFLMDSIDMTSVYFFTGVLVITVKPILLGGDLLNH